jgi:starch-binding outer membrane protein, SusD/RagB family
MRMRKTTLLGGVTLAALAAGCDFEVINPGPIQEVFLEEQLAQPAVVNGMGRAVAQGLNWLAYTGAAVTREIHPAGSTAAFGISNDWSAGRLLATDRDLNTHWQQAARARWLAESGLERIERTGPATPQILTQAQLWAGYANRLLGEHYCEAVIDGGPVQPRNEFLNRAEQFFTQAAAGSSGNLRLAALAGRASVRLNLGKYAEAAADAQQVPIGFTYQIPYYSVGSDDQRNRIAWAGAGTPYRAHTLWNTVYEDIGRSNQNPTGDPRVTFNYTPGQTGDAAIQCCGRVPFKQQRKHPTDAAPINLSSGREMRLIQAEALLVAGNAAGALALINEVRAYAEQPALEAAGSEAVWTILKRERGMELWLEGRRMSDMFRWDAANRPGAYGTLERPGTASNLARQDLCFPIPPTEQETNPNVPIA